jgi:hypothetical protein
VKRKELAAAQVDYALNWPIKLRELSIRLQERSQRIVRDALRLYVDGLINEETLIEIIRLSGVPIHKYTNPRRYVVYENEKPVENLEELVINEFDEVDEVFTEVKEEYLGERVIRRLMVNDD